MNGLLEQLESFRSVQNTNPNRLAPVVADPYDGDGYSDDESASDEGLSDVSDAGSVDLEEALYTRTVLRKGYFTEEELNEFQRILKSDTPFKELKLEPFITKASRIFARYGGKDFVNDRFRLGLEGTFAPFGDDGKAQFEKYKQQALGEPLEVPVPPPVSEAIFSAAETSEEDSTDEEDSAGNNSSEERQRRLDLARVVEKLPSNWNNDGAEDAMTKWQKYAWIFSESRNDQSYVPRKILGDLWNTETFPREFLEMGERMAATRENLSTTQWQAAGQNGRVIVEGRAAGDLVSKFRPGMVWSDKSNNFRLISMFHDPEKPREVMFVHTRTSSGSQGSTVWVGTLDKHIHAAGEQEYGSERISFKPYTSYNPERPFPVDFQREGALGPSTRFHPFVYANNKGFYGQLRFNVGDRYFCPEWDGDGYEGEIVSFEMYTVVSVEENQYVVFKKDGEDTEISPLIRVSVSRGETSDVTLIPGGHLLKIEYATLQNDDWGEDRTIYATYTPNIKESVEELQADEQEMRRHNAARDSGNSGSESGSGLGSDSGDGSGNSGANFAIAFADQISDAGGAANEADDLNDLGIVQSGSLQRTAYYGRRKAGSKKPLSRFRVGETIEGKGRKGAKATLTITKRGTRNGSADEYLNVDVTDSKGEPVEKVQYKIRMNSKDYPRWGTNANCAFEVATLEATLEATNKNCPKGISAWKQACPLGYENGVTYSKDLQNNDFFKVVERDLSGKVVVEDGDGTLQLEVQINSGTNANLRWEKLMKPFGAGEQLDGFPQRVYAGEPPICKEEYDATARKTKRTAAAVASGASRASRNKFTEEAFDRYKELVEQEDSVAGDWTTTMDDEGKAELHQFRARAAKLLGRGFKVQMLLEPNFSKRKNDWEYIMQEEYTEPKELMYFYFKNLKLMLDEEAFAAEKKEVIPYGETINLETLKDILF